MVNMRSFLSFFAHPITTATRLYSSVPKSIGKHLPTQKKVSDLATNKLPPPYWDGSSFDNWLDSVTKNFIKRGGRIRSQTEIDKANEELCPGYTKFRKETEAKAVELLKALSKNIG